MQKRKNSFSLCLHYLWASGWCEPSVDVTDSHCVVTDLKRPKSTRWILEKRSTVAEVPSDEPLCINHLRKKRESCQWEVTSNVWMKHVAGFHCGRRLVGLVRTHVASCWGGLLVNIWPKKQVQALPCSEHNNDSTWAAWKCFALVFWRCSQYLQFAPFDFYVLSHEWKINFWWNSLWAK